MTRRVVVTTGSFGAQDEKPLSILRENGYEVLLNSTGRTLQADEVVQLCSGVAGFVAGTEKLDVATLERLPGLKVISRCGTGVDNIDLEAAKRLDIAVYNTPDAPTDAVAELTIGLMLSLLRHIPRSDRDERNGVWKKRMGNLLSGKRIGILGFGRIGKRVAELAASFGCCIAFQDPYYIECCDVATSMAKEELLAWSDIVSIHASSGGCLIGQKELELMKQGAWLVNVGRGGMVDEEALQQALVTGRLAGAALDVYSREPYDGPLKDLDTAILTPHIGSYAHESRVRMECEAAENLVKGLELS